MKTKAEIKAQIAILCYIVALRYGALKALCNKHCPACHCFPIYPLLAPFRPLADSKPDQEHQISLVRHTNWDRLFAVLACH